MKKGKQVLLIVFLIAFLSVLLLFIAWKSVMENTIRNVQDISVSMPDLSDIQDGNYVGEYSISLVYVQVEVFINNHQITDIVIRQHDNGSGSAAESIVNDVMEEQSLDIDAVSGATVSSKCILKAVENAIENSEKGDLKNENNSNL